MQSEPYYKLWTLGDNEDQCRFLSDNLCTILVGDADNRGGYAFVGAEDTGEISVLCTQFCCELITDLKIKA